MNKLATIKRLKNVRSHPNADRLKIAEVGDYQVVTAADASDGDLVVYFAIDAILPEWPVFEFMRPHKFRVKMAKLRGEISNGLVIPVAELKDRLPEAPVEELLSDEIDLSEYLGVRKYHKPIPPNLAGDVVGDFPTHLCSKTDEDRFENYPDLFDAFAGREVYVTLKLDGSSATFINDGGTLRVCSRNLELKDTEKNTLWRLARKYDLVKKLPEGLALQCECVGEGVLKNPMGLKGQDIYCFNVVVTKTRKLLPATDIALLTEALDLPMVPTIFRGKFKWESLKELKEFANQAKYENGSPAEGIVVRPVEPVYSQKLGKELSLKVISENYKE